MFVTHRNTLAFQAFHQAICKKFSSNWRSCHSLML